MSDPGSPAANSPNPILQQIEPMKAVYGSRTGGVILEPSQIPQTAVLSLPFLLSLFALLQPLSHPLPLLLSLPLPVLLSALLQRRGVLRAVL